MLRDDSIRLAQKAREAGVRVELQVFPVVPHVWQLIQLLPEARRSVRAAAHFLHTALPSAEPEELDVLIIGAGLSGIGATVHLQRACPDKTFTLLEARTAIGGTWDLFRYPGVRSDSDMYTLGYHFKPWRAAQAIADGPAILDYIRETAVEHGIGAHIRTQHRLISADWQADEARWRVQIERGPQRQRLQMKPRFLLFCSGYYRYAQGHQPGFPGQASFAGRLLHPQFWPAGLDYAGQRVVVVGSGATAVTLVPELAKNVLMGLYFFRLARKYPVQAKARLVGLVQAALGPGFDVARHFTPRYKPWDQRVCLVPDGDLFQALRAGRASVVTDQIETFTEHGIRLQSGQELAADIIVSATGLQLNLLGDVKLSLGGQPVDAASLLVYKGMMFSGLPNLANTFGYTHASWTLKADLTAGYFCRLLNHLDRTGQTIFTPIRDASVLPAPFLDFTSGYVQRAAGLLPKQGDRKPWKLYQNYVLDLLTLRWGKLADGVMAFGRGGRGGRG